MTLSRTFLEPYGSKARAVEETVGAAAYETVKTVADNIVALAAVGANITELLSAADTASETLETILSSGRIIYKGEGAPSSGLGSNGDFYIDETGWQIYGAKSEGAWGTGTSLVGPTGPTGTLWLTGSGVPSSGAGSDDDLYLDTATGDVYEKSEGAWSFSTNIRGANGDGTGTVTSVGISVPSGLQVANSPITSTGNISITFASGYSIPTTVKQGQWDTAYGWGDHGEAGYASASAVAAALANASNWDDAYGWGNHASAGYATTSGVAAGYQPKATVLTNTTAAFTTELKASYDTAVGWGNHASAGYLTSIADNSITLAKMEHGTEGDILYYAASGAPTRLGKGTAGQKLVMNADETAPEWADDEGGWELIADVEPETDATEVVITGVSGYRDLKMIFVGKQNSTGIVSCSMRATAGTWRYCGSLAGTGAGAFVGHFTIIDAGRANAVKLAIGFGGTNIGSGFDRSDADENGSTSSIQLRWSTYNETIDEVRVNAAGTIEGSDPDARAHIRVYGMGRIS